jgi:hypothetical protein
MPGDLSPTLLDFIRSCVPTYPAAEVLVFFAANSGRDFSIDELVTAIRPTAIAAPAAREYVEFFRSRQLLDERDGKFCYRPGTAELEHGVRELVLAYNERPVTLIRAIYGIADSHIQSFADSFRLRNGGHE